MWRARFGRGFGPVVRQTAKWIIIIIIIITLRNLEFMWLLYSGAGCGRVLKYCMEITVRNMWNIIAIFVLWNVL
jgi:hypothetical protein